MSERKAAMARNAFRALYLVPAMVPVLIPLIVLGSVALVARWAHVASAAGAEALQRLWSKMPDFEPLPGSEDPYDPER